jgi:hypothetical protein
MGVLDEPRLNSFITQSRVSSLALDLLYLCLFLPHIFIHVFAPHQLGIINLLHRHRHIYGEAAPTCLQVTTNKCPSSSSNQSTSSNYFQSRNSINAIKPEATAKSR